MREYLEATKIVDFNSSIVLEKAKELAIGCSNDEEIAKRAFEFVRDKIKHSGDYPSDVETPYCASQVLARETGWCYAKAILLAALLRANGVPTGFAYQRLSCSEYKPDIYCLHGLNWIYLKKHGWYKVDARGNKKGVDAQFTPPIEKLAFNIAEGEYNITGNFSSPIPEIMNALHNNKSYKEMVANFPDTNFPYIGTLYESNL